MISSKILSIKDSITKNRILCMSKNDNFDEISKQRISDVKLIKEIDADGYYSLLNKIYSFNIDKIKNKEKIKVCFVLANASMWSCDELYSIFESDSRFEPCVVLCREDVKNIDSRENNFKLSKEFFDKTQYRKIYMSTEVKDNKCYEAMNCPDIIFYLNPYSILYPVGCNLVYMPQKVLSVYIPYSFMLSDAPNKFNDPGMSLTWRHFADSNYYRELLIDNDKYKKLNTYYFGYPKMDVYYSDSSKKKEDIWKFADLEKRDETKCIIYAPHHSLPNSKVCTQHFSTFHHNYRTILDYAKNNVEKTSWIVKPHPILGRTSVEEGLFDSIDEYKNYLKEWEALPNAKVVEESTYYDIFKTSDAMILDSVSFTAEYQYTHKPLLFLTKEGQNFNEFGADLQKVLYHAKGDDIGAINKFLDDIVIKGDDVMFDERKEFFDRYLNYRIDDNKSASERIFEHIEKQIFN